MYTPKISRKRALTLLTAGALAATAGVTFVGSSQAAVATYKLGSTTTSVSQAVTVAASKGVDFTDDNGVSEIDLTKIAFLTTACPTTKASAGSILGTSGVAVSDSKITLVSPSVLALTASKPTKYNVCFFAAGANTLLGSATVTVYTAPTGSAQTISSPATPAGPTYGGSKITITGQDLTSGTKIMVGGTLATDNKVVLGKTGSDPDSITATTPPGAVASAAVVKVVGEYGAITIAGANATWAYKSAIKVSPSGSDGAIGRVITVTGSGFKANSWASQATAAKSAVYLVPADFDLTTFASGGAAVPAPGAGEFKCGSINVIDDNTLECSLTAAMTSAYGAYTVAIVTIDAAGAYVAPSAGSSTGFSRGATYTAATI